MKLNVWERRCAFISAGVIKITGIVTGFYRDEEYPFPMEKALELVKNTNPKFKDI